MNLNKTQLAGNLVRDPVLKYTPKGDPVLDFSIAVNHRWIDDQGQKREDTYFGECRAWGKQAETIAQHFHQGKPIFIEGRLAQEKWIDSKTQQERRKTLTIVREWQFCGESRGAAGAGGKREAAPAPRPGVGNATGRETMGEVFHDGPPSGVEADDIPF
jgi:single-strand DNA-binding protein